MALFYAIKYRIFKDIHFFRGGSMRIFISCVRVIPFILLMVSCGAYHTVELKDEFHGPGFHYGLLQEKGLIVGGVPQGPVTLSSMQQMQIGMQLSNILLEKLEDADKIRLITPAQLLDALGNEKYSIHARQFDTYGNMDSLTLAVLNDSLPSTGYTLFAEIETESVIRDRDESYERNEKGEDELIIEYYTLYRMSVEFRLYDLQSGLLVFSVRVMDSARRSEDENLGAGCITQMINSMINSLISPGEPAEITREEVLQKIFTEFATALPARTAIFHPKK